MPKQRHYLCIDLKSFYASVECVERGLDPMTTRLVVADPSRSSNTICLAVSPALKKLGVKNRCRYGEIPPNIDYITAPPRMQKYIDYATMVYRIYLKHFSKDDIHVYSIDEAFMDVTDYLSLYNCTPRELGQRILTMIQDELGIRGTCGIGTNLYLTKIALDITAKHSPDFIGELTEESYRETLWNHRPLTDFWRVGRGTASRLAKYAIYTMGDIAHADEDFLYSLFGIDAELLIDHAWGREPVTIADIKTYKPRTSSLSNGQVLMHDYSFEKARIIVKEMADQLCLELTQKNLVTQSLTLYIGYSGNDNVNAPRTGHVGGFARVAGEPFASGTVSLTSPTAASVLIVPAIADLYEKITDPTLTVRRVNITCNNTMTENYHQMDLFSDTEEVQRAERVQQAVVEIKSKYGKNSLVKGMNLEDGAMTMERNRQIGGHRA